VEGRNRGMFSASSSGGMDEESESGSGSDGREESSDAT
jgi:hypothetical protein